MKAYTDYPITQLGDKPGQLAPIREIEVLSYDGNKYATINVEGCVTEIKLGYCYTQPGRSGDVPVIKTQFCNRSACGKPDAVWWNTSTCAYYCGYCATSINKYNPGLCVNMETCKCNHPGCPHCNPR